LESRMTYKSELDLKLDVAQKVYRDKKDSATKTIKKIKTK